LAEYKKQHQIPKTYMKHFSIDGKMSVMIGEFDDVKIVENIPYKNQCYENFYYGDDLIWENRLGEIENDAEPVINSILEGKHVLTSLELQKMYKFISFQIARVPSHVNKWLYNQAHILHTGIMMQKDHGLDVPEMDFFDTLDWIIKNKKRETIDNVLNIANNNSKYLFDLDYLIVDFTTLGSLVFSDNPVIQQNDLFLGSGGLGMAGLIIILPLAPGTAFILFDRKIYEYPKNENHYIVSNVESDISKINTCEIVIREKLVYFDISNNKEKILYTNKKFLPFRSVYLDNLRPTNFGDKDEKIIMASNRYMSKKMDLSFLHLNKYVNRVKIIDLYLPRLKDKKTLERMSYLREIYKDHFSKEDFDNYETFINWYYA